jgi:hypothetical protein
MAMVQFTQYIRPDGRTKPITIDVPRDIADKAERLAEWDVHFTAEILRTEEISLTAEDATINETLDIEVVLNGPEVIDAVNRLINNTYALKFSQEPQT